MKTLQAHGRKISLEGFTLVEMAIVMVVMGLVIVTVLPALNTVRSASKTSLTQSNLRSLMTATAAFVQANGCLPCPAIPGGNWANFGKLGYSSPSTVCGYCDRAQGIAPFAALGIPASTAKDGWGHWITMRIDPALANPANCGSASNPCSNFIPPYAVCTTSDNANGFCASQSNNSVGFSTKGLCKYNLSAALRLPYQAAAQPISVWTTGGGSAQRAAVIFVSHGSQGYGSYKAAPSQTGYMLPFPSNYAPCPMPSKGASQYSGFAQCNSAENNSSYFYEALASAKNNDPYDGQMIYADRNALVSMFGNGACATAW